MDNIIEQFVETDEQNDVIIADHTTKMEELENDLVRCEASIKNLKDTCEPMWDSERAVLKGLMSEASKLQKGIDSLKIDKSMRQSFRPIDLSFLARRQILEIPEKVSVPLFSVHKTHSNQVDDMEMRIRYDLRPRVRVKASFFRVGYRLPEVFSDHLVNAFGVGEQTFVWKKEGASEYEGRIAMGKKKFKWLKTSDAESFRRKFVSKFVGIIPAEVKEKIQEAREISEEVYLIKEAQWDVQEIVTDPLIVCISPTGEAYLIGSFDCTPVEYWAKKEF